MHDTNIFLKSVNILIDSYLYDTDRPQSSTLNTVSKAAT